MKNKLLNEELRRIKDMMKKINESRFFDDSGEFLGGPDPSEDDYNHDEYFEEKLTNFISKNFPEMDNNLDLEFSYRKGKFDTQETRIKITTIDGSEIPEQFREEIRDEFNVSDEDEDYIEVLMVYDGPDYDVD